MFNRRCRIFILSLFVLLAGSRLYAQANSKITGTVTDKEGAAIPDAQVTVTDTATGFVSSTDTNSVGIYAIPGLNVGIYDLKVTAKGFQTSVQKGLQVNVSQVLRADVTLSVGSVSETVTVAANALTVQADSNVVSTLISAEQISEIATQNRNFAQLAAMGLGASSLMPDNNTPSSGAGGSSFNLSINGLRQSHNIWLIDGGESDDRGGAGGMQIMPSQDSIAQFEVLSSNYPPDYGISSGATISLGLKSGTRAFHGSVWEFNRNTVYNANYFLNKQANPVRNRPGLNYNIYGFNIGGPLTIPGVYNRDRSRTFFFWNEEWRKVRQSPSPNTNPTLPAADFPVAGQSLHYVAPAFSPNAKILVPNNVADPAYLAKLSSLGLTPGTPFPNDTIPAALIDPNAVAYLGSGVVPKPNTADGKALTSAPTPLDVRDDVVRIDHRITDKWQILGHYIHDSVTQAQGGPMLGWSGGSYNTITSTVNNPSNSAAIKLTGSISPNLLAEASFNYDGNQIDIINSPNSLRPAGFTASRFFNNSSKNLPNMQWNGSLYSGTQENPASGPWHNAAQDYSPRVDISYLRGKHSMKFGFSYNRYTKNQQLFGNWGGAYSWNDSATAGTYNGVTYSGDAFMSMVLGLSSSFSQAQDLPIRHYVNETTSFYVDDNWKVTPTLSLQLGLRYDALPHAWERGNNVSNFDPNGYISSQAPKYIASANPLVYTGQMDPNGPGFATVNGSRFYLNGVYQAGANGAPRGLVKNDYGTLQPRVGFSDDLFGNGKTILRGGFGTFFERMQGNDIYNSATTAPFFNNPSASSVYLSNPSTSWVTGQTAAQPFFAQGITTMDKRYPAPAVAQFSLGVQREIRPSVVAVVQYVGNMAWHQNIDRRINNYSVNTPMNIRAYAGDSSADPSKNNYGVSGTNTFVKTTTDVQQQLTNGDFNRIYQGWGQITQQENTSNGNYNGFQVGVRAQSFHNLSGEVDYTWSHEIDLTSQDLQQVSNPWNLKYDKGSGAFDRRHILNMNYIYKLPFFTNPGLTHTLLGGWEVAGTAVFQTGTIVNNGGIGNLGPSLSVGYDTVGLGGGYSNRPDVTGKIHYTKKQKQWFDPSVFKAPTPAWVGSTTQGFGNARKDVAVGPGRVNFNTSLYKTFAITERTRFEFRAESFNTFNHTQFNNIGNSFTGLNADGTAKGSFGQVTSTQDPRTLELGAKIVF
jgi:hypothetical protein